jgi:DNA-binding IclR family transcriptional regulator
LDDKYRLDTLRAALRLIDHFLTSPKHELGVTELSRELGLTKSQTYRILQNLLDFDYVQKNARTRKYQLGLKFLSAGRVVSQRINLLREARPVLHRLRDRLDETIHLVLTTDKGPVCVAERQSSQRLRFFADVGMRLPWHAGSASKLLLAYLPPEQQEEILAGDGLEAYSPRTITDPARLRAELAQIRLNGYATSHGEMTASARAAAAPIRDHSGAVVATISVVGPADRLADEKMASAIQQVTVAGHEISARLGFVDEP